MRKFLLAIAALLLLLPLFISALHFVLLHPPGPWETYRVRGVSMQPAIQPGDIIVNRGCDPADIRVGDVVTFARQDRDAPFVTHRVVHISTDQNGAPRFITKGDNALWADQPFSGEAIVGRLVFVVPRVGAAQEWMLGNLLATAVCAGLMFLLFWSGTAVLVFKAGIIKMNAISPTERKTA